VGIKAELSVSVLMNLYRQCCLSFSVVSLSVHVDGDQFSEKPGNVREFDSCQGTDHMSGKVSKMSGKDLVRANCPWLTLSLGRCQTVFIGLFRLRSAIFGKIFCFLSHSLHILVDF